MVQSVCSCKEPCSCITLYRVVSCYVVFGSNRSSCSSVIVFFAISPVLLYYCMYALESRLYALY